MNISLQTQVLNIVKESGDIVKGLLTQDNILEEKGQDNFLTYIDLEVQRFLIEKLSFLLPESTIISEEKENLNINSSEFIWVIDPIDGTTNLIHNYPHFCTSVALVKKGKPIFGVISNPITSELFHSILNNGAFLNNQKISVSETSTLANSIIGFGFPYDKQKISNTIEKIKAVINSSQDLRRTGSAALDLAYVACGRLDGYFEFDLEIWDYIAGYLLIKEAGGAITDMSNDEFGSFSKTNLVASNGLIQTELIQCINKQIT